MNIDYDNSSIPELINYFKEEDDELIDTVNRRLSPEKFQEALDKH